MENKYKIPELKNDIKSYAPIEVAEMVVGHTYLINNRHTSGHQELNFAMFKTHKEMVDAGYPDDVINAIVPDGERNESNCCMYLVTEGCFTQDVIEALIQRMKYQYGWFRHGFYADGIAALEKAKLQYELFTEIRMKYGFYHIPFSMDKFLEEISKKTEFEIAEDRDLINKFMEFDDSDCFWRLKSELIAKIKSVNFVRNL